MQNSTAKQRARLMVLATYASVTVALIIIVSKIIAWILTDSLSLLTSLVDSALDMGSSLINLFAVRYSLKPADEDHRFGHGKAEEIAALVQSAFIGGSALFILIEALRRFSHPQVIENTHIGIWAMIASIFLTLGLVLFQRYVAKRTRSVAVKADSLHYVGDLAVNVSIILVLVAMRFYQDAFWIDPAMALLIACYMGYTAWKVGRMAFDLLMDKEFAEEERDQIKTIVLSNIKVRGMHDLRTRRSGGKSFIQFHLELDAKLPLIEAHAISDQIATQIRAHFLGAEVIIHEDPEHGNALPLQSEQVKNIVIPDDASSGITIQTVAESGGLPRRRQRNPK